MEPRVFPSGEVFLRRDRFTHGRPGHVRAGPELVGDDAEIGSLNDLPVLTRDWPLDDLLRARLTLRNPLTPDLFPEIPLVVQDAVNRLSLPRMSCAPAAIEVLGGPRIPCGR